jgi:hypothetical protein
MGRLRRGHLTRRLAAPVRGRRALSVLALVVALAGCVEPGVQLKPFDMQYGMSNARDWDAAADRLIRSLEMEGFIPSGMIHPDRKPFPPPYYINVMAQGSAFLEEVKHSLEFQLLRRDFVVVRSPVGATVINLDVNVVQWGSTAYGTGGFDILPGGVVPVTRTELVWRATITEGNRVTVKGQETVYVPAEDVALYLGTSQLPTMGTPGAAVLGSAVPLRYAR